MQLLLGDIKFESTVCYLRIRVIDTRNGGADGGLATLAGQRIGRGAIAGAHELCGKLSEAHDDPILRAEWPVLRSVTQSGDECPPAASAGP